jgi:hypothetical protein
MHNARTIHVQCVHGCSSNGGFPKEMSAISTPVKMTMPTVPSWVKQSDATACLRIVRRDLRPFRIVTNRAGVTQIIHLSLAPHCSWDNVIDFKRFRTQLLLQLTVFVAELRTFSDELSNRCWEVG